MPCDSILPGFDITCNNMTKPGPMQLQVAPLRITKLRKPIIPIVLTPKTDILLKLYLRFIGLGNISLVFNFVMKDTVWTLHKSSSVAKTHLYAAFWSRRRILLCYYYWWSALGLWVLDYLFARCTRFLGSRMVFLCHNSYSGNGKERIRSPRWSNVDWPIRFPHRLKYDSRMLVSIGPSDQSNVRNHSCFRSHHLQSLEFWGGRWLFIFPTEAFAESAIRSVVEGYAPNFAANRSNIIHVQENRGTLTLFENRETWKLCSFSFVSIGNAQRNGLILLELLSVIHTFFGIENPAGWSVHSRQVQFDEFFVTMRNRPIDVADSNLNGIMRDAIEVDFAWNYYRCLLGCFQVTRYDSFTRPEQSANLLKLIAMKWIEHRLNRTAIGICVRLTTRTLIDDFRLMDYKVNFKQQTQRVYDVFATWMYSRPRSQHSMWRLSANLALFLYGTYLNSRERDAEWEWENIGISVTWLVHTRPHVNGQSTSSANTTSQSVSRSGTFTFNIFYAQRMLSLFVMYWLHCVDSSNVHE